MDGILSSEMTFIKETLLSGHVLIFYMTALLTQVIQIYAWLDFVHRGSYRDENIISRYSFMFRNNRYYSFQM